MIQPTGATSVSVDVQIVSDAGLPVTGLVAATFPAVTYSLAGPNAAVPVTLSDLAAITSAWASGGVKERSGGYYRLDLPDAAFATGGIVRVEGEASGKHLLAAEVQVGIDVPVRAAVGMATANLDDQLVTMDSDINAGATAASVAAAAAVAVDGRLPASPAAVGDAMTLTAGERTAVADALIGRNIKGGSSAGRTVGQALAAQRNKVAFDVPAPGQFTVFDTDDTTPLWTGTYTASAGANPVTVLDPA
jgi:hypothetical protein